MSVIILAEGTIPPEVHPIEWALGQPLECKLCHTVFALPDNAEQTSKNWPREIPVGSWEVSLSGFREWYPSTIYLTTCPACKRTVEFSQHRVGPFWHRRWWSR